MRLPLLLVLTFVMLLSYSEGGSSTWFPNIVDSFTNKTSQITSYVRDKGRSIKNYYVQTVRSKINSYFGRHPKETKIVKTIKSQETDAEAKGIFRDYLAGLQGTDKISIESVSVENVHQCSNDDPTIQFSTPQLIALHGYPAESHTIVTADGYILTVHRIPHNKKGAIKRVPRKTVLLHHGLLGSSADWIITGPNKSLAFMLSDVGYDVWLANVRGNTYSRAHVSRSIDSYEFWNFTFHDVSQHDLPAVIDYIMDIKGWDIKINYIGHSMGTSVLFALLSTKTQYNKVLRAGFALAPVAYMSDIQSPIKILAKFSNNLEYLMKLLGANEFLPQNSVLRWLSKHACEINHYEEVICENSLFVLCGHDDKQFNRTLLPMILNHVPAGASTKTLIHYAQEIHNDGRFQQFDYGAKGNIKQYGQITPPEYPLNKITLPIALFSAENDWLASTTDVTNLYAQLENPIDHYIVPLKEFNHIDFLWAVDAPTLVYAKLLQLMEDGIGTRAPTHSVEESNILDE